MASVYNCADSTIEVLKNCDLFYKKKWLPVTVGLRFLRAFLSYIPKWSDADEVVSQRLGDLVKRIEDAFPEVELEGLDDAAEQGDEESLDAARSSLLEKIERFKPEIKKAYNDLSEYILECRDPVNDYDTWQKFIDFIRDTLGELVYERYVTGGAKKQFEELAANLELLGRFISTLVHKTNPCKQFIDLWVHLGTLAMYAANLSCSCWDEKMDNHRAKEITSRASYLLQKIKPTTTEAVQMYLKVMKSVTYWTGEHTANNFLQFLLPMTVRVEPIINLQEGLEFLVTFVLSAPEERAKDVEQISSDIRVAIMETASLKFSRRGGSPTDVPLYLLLQKIELLKLEVVLMNLISSTKAKDQDTFGSLQKGVRFLQIFFKHPPELTEKVTRILTRIEAVVEEIGTLIVSFHTEQIKEDTVRDALRLLVNISLLKAEAFFMELTMKSEASSMEFARDQIENLHEGLEFLRNFLSGPQQQKPNDAEKYIQIDALAKEATSLYYSLCFGLATNDTINDRSLVLSRLLDKINLVKSEAQDTYLNIRSSSTLNFPKTDGMGFVEFFLENLRQLLKHKANSMDSVKHQIEAVLQELESVTLSIKAVRKQGKHQRPELEDVCAHVTHVAYQADYAIDSILLKNGAVWYHMLSLSDLVHKVKLIKAEVEEIKEKVEVEEIKEKTEVEEIKEKAEIVEIKEKAELEDMKEKAEIEEIAAPIIEEVLPVLEDQEKCIIARLKSGSRSLDIVPIVGMAGSGKTTLAKKVFDNVKNQFYVHAWCSISQVYRRRETLLKILGDIIELTDKIHEKPDEDLALLLLQSLSRNKYIVVLDDVWDNQAWNDLRSAFPDHHNGSRILLTSRDSKVASEAKDDSVPICLRPLSPDESWKFLEKLFSEGSCDKDLLQTGRLIAESCKGLPLALVAISGLLKRNKMEVDGLKQIAEDLNSHILEDEESTCKHILELSYNHLPDYLKPYFLYFGAFERSKEVPVQKLIQLWIAEGFVRKVDQKSLLEETAEDYLMDLIARSLVMADSRGSTGRVKACRMHDTFHEFCLSKVEEENFLESRFWYDKHFSSSHSVSYEQHRVSICSSREHFVNSKPSGPRVRSLLFSATSDRNPRYAYDLSFVCCNFKLLRVLDVENINVGNSFPKGIELMDQLRYLAICGYIDSIPSSIAKLWRLEILLVNGLGGKVALPDAIWSMAMLRHLHVNDIAIFSLPGKDFKHSRLDNLVSLSSPSLQYGEDMEKILKKCLKLRKMRCMFSESPGVSDDCNHFPVLDFLTELVSLHISYQGNVRQSCKFSIPLNLKKLTLSDFRLPWDCISVIGKLPQLQVLKLISQAFDGPTWDMKDGKFPELKFLKIDSSEVEEWNASDDHLPKLATLILRSCKKLQEVPPSILERGSLEMVELRWCSTSAENSVREVQEDLEQEGVKIFINVLDGTL